MLYKNLAAGTRFNIGVFWQLGPTDTHMLPDSLNDYNIKNLFCTHTDSLGCCYARNRLHVELYSGEDYVLSIDSHTRFIQNWDQILIDLFNRFDGHRVISTYPNGYEPPNTILNSVPHKIQAHGQNSEGLPLLSPARCGNVPQINYYIAGGFLFGDGQMFRDVSYDKYLYFFGEEISLAIRFYTSGYDIWNPGRTILYHYYVRASSPHHWEDNKTPVQIKFRDDSVKRVKHLMNLKVSLDPTILTDIEKYGLGNKRTLTEYYDVTGIKHLPIMR